MVRYFVILLLLISCKAQERVDSVSEPQVIQMIKTSCRGRCPEYTVIIKSDGRIFLDAKKNFAYIGKFQGDIPPIIKDILFAEFEKAQFFSFKNRYPTMKTDLPATILSFTHGGTTKRIVFYNDAPAELITLKKKIEEIVETYTWSKPSE